MGFLAWLATGVVLAIVARLIGQSRLLPNGAPNGAAGPLGAVLGGFIADLVLRGDSVMNFRGPTLIGAVIGGIVMIVIFSIAGLRPANGR